VTVFERRSTFGCDLNVGGTIFARTGGFGGDGVYFTDDHKPASAPISLSGTVTITGKHQNVELECWAVFDRGVCNGVGLGGPCLGPSVFAWGNSENLTAIQVGTLH
jgi:hypothetical protein